MFAFHVTQHVFYEDDSFQLLVDFQWLGNIHFRGSCGKFFSNTGSSAGAGSEVFHVYRHLRRYEMSRQQWIEETAKAEDKDTEFLMRLAEKKVEAEEKTAKKRAKRSGVDSQAQKKL